MTSLDARSKPELEVATHRDVADEQKRDAALSASVALDSWWNNRRRFTVELLTSGVRPNPMVDLLAKLHSPSLSPQVRLNSEYSNRYNHFLEIDGTATRIAVRHHSFFSKPTVYTYTPGADAAAAGADGGTR